MTSKNLRELLNVNPEYHTFNREERYYAALLYHFLLKPKGLRKFLDLIGDDSDQNNARIFFEYAHARDLWFEFKAAANKEPGFDLALLNEKLRSVIVSRVDPTDSLGLLKYDVRKFNDLFGAKSTKHIQMPGRWSKLKFSKWVDLGGRDFAERACTLIWAFNAKADLVIHTSNNRAICIEAKVDSAESIYTATAGEGAPLFIRTQTQIQEFILDDLLGYETTYVLLTVNGNARLPSKHPGKQWNALSWEKVFDLIGPTDIEPTEEIPFVKASLKSHIIAEKSPAITKLRNK